LEAAFAGARVEIAGSAIKAKQICEKFPPTIIIWDGIPDEHGTREEYVNCIPTNLWNHVLPISNDEESLAFAKSKGSHPPLPKQTKGVNTWSDAVVTYLKSVLKK
jgi:hypothetical protein